MDIRPYVEGYQHSEALATALRAVVKMYVELVDSGDAGFWDAEEVDEVIASRAALKDYDERIHK